MAEPEPGTHWVRMADNLAVTVRTCHLRYGIPHIEAEGPGGFQQVLRRDEWLALYRPKDSQSPTPSVPAAPTGPVTPLPTPLPGAFSEGEERFVRFTLNDDTTASVTGTYHRETCRRLLLMLDHARELEQAARRREQELRAALQKLVDA